MARFRILCNEQVVHEAESLQDIFSFIEARTWLAMSFYRLGQPAKVNISCETNDWTTTTVEGVGLDEKIDIHETLDIQASMVYLALQDSSQIPNIKAACEKSNQKFVWTGNGAGHVMNTITERVRNNYTIIDGNETVTKWNVNIKFR